MSAPERQPRVLVIDDRPGIREVFREFLDVLGYGADVAPDGDRGLAMVAAGSYGLVITDLRMPGMSGIEVATSVRREHPGLQVIVVTGSAEPEELDQLRGLNVPCLSKPVTLQDFTAAVARAFGPAAPGGCPLALDAVIV